MYNKEIYQQWEMHHDATQLEIKYKFLSKVIDILSVNSLIDRNYGIKSKEITDNKLIKDWQSYNLNETIDNFFAIINDGQEYSYIINETLTIFEKAIFLSGVIINELKKTNYKANELDIYYEPRLFLVAQKILKIEMLEKWISTLCSRVHDANIITYDEDMISLEITINAENINNVMWYVDNLCMSFKEIYTWYNNMFSLSNVNASNKSIVVNVLNHMIVYSLTDFYAKLNHLNSKSKNFNNEYQHVLNSIKTMLSKGRFAIDAYKAISTFISKILVDGYIDSNDQIIVNFLNIVSISCSYNNQKYFEESIYKLKNEQNEVSEDVQFSDHEWEQIERIKRKIDLVKKISNENESFINHDFNNDKNDEDLHDEFNENLEQTNYEKNHNEYSNTKNHTKVLLPTKSLNSGTNINKKTYSNQKQEINHDLQEKAKLITKNLDDQFRSIEVSDEILDDSEDEIQKIINKKTSYVIQQTKPTIELNLDEPTETTKHNKE